MPKVTFVKPNDSRIEVDIPVGTSVMRGALNGGIDGIIGDCGGQASCATCHVFVEGDFAGALPPVSAEEDEMLDCAAADRRPNSRLSCQVIMTEAFEGLVVQIPDDQV